MSGTCSDRPKTTRPPCHLATLPAVLAAIGLAGLAASTPAAPAADRGAVIPIRGVIDDILRDSIERRLRDAVAERATTIIFEMDTPGGLVTSALDIFRIIERFEGRTVAWVNPEAYSAGALISVACDEIWMSPSSSLGDCAPIIMGMSEMGETERAKAESPILQKFRAAAARHGYDQALSRAMVTVGEEVWWVENTTTGERRFVTAEEKDKLLGSATSAPATAPSSQPVGQWKLVETYVDPDSEVEFPITQPVDRADTLLTMSESEAVAYGFSRGTAATISELADRLGLADVPLRFDQTGWENFAGWLNSPLVRGILLIIVLIGAYAEFHSPGLILPGATALIALVIFLAAPYAAGLSWAWPLVLLGLGLVLLGIEIFVVPGFGIAGLLGLAFIVIAILASFVPAVPELPPFGMPDLSGVWEGFATGVKVLATSLVISIVGILLLIHYLPESRIMAGVVTGNPKADELAISDAHAAVAHPGDIGVVTGDLRPGGQARFGQEIVDVHSQGEYVEAGRRVQVLHREGMHIVVRPLPESNQA